PVGPLVRRIVQNVKTGIQFLPRRVVVQDLVDMYGMHGGKHTGFFRWQRGASTTPDISSDRRAWNSASPRGHARWRRNARAALVNRSDVPNRAPNRRGSPHESR